MLEDTLYRQCIRFATKSVKEREHYGALCIKNGLIIGRGCNRDALPDDFVQMGPILHGEGCSVNNALRNGYDPRGADVFVAGYFLSDEMLNIRTGPIFTCDLCPDVLARFGIASINVPTINGWGRLTPAEALKTAKDLMIGLVGDERTRKRRTVGESGLYLRDLISF